MLRESTNPALRWADKTLSLLQERQLEASEDRLSAWPEFGLFSPETTERHLPALWNHSCLALETGAQPMCSLQALRTRVLDAVPGDALFLSADEIEMLLRMLREDGTVELFDLEESATAELLMRRLWCHPEWLDEERVLLHLAPEVAMRLMPALNSKAMDRVQTALAQLAQRISAALFQRGAIIASDALSLMRGQVTEALGEPLPPAADTAMKHWLRASFDYSYDKTGAMILLHPGLAEPEKVLPCPLRELNTEELTLDMIETFLGVSPSNNSPLYQLSRLLPGALRPELSPLEAGQDLLILAKQGVPFGEMQDALASMLMIVPTPGMIRALKELCAEVLPWPCFRPAVIH